MAANTGNQDNMVAANGTFSSFMTGLKYGGIAVFIIAAFVIFLLAR